MSHITKMSNTRKQARQSSRSWNHEEKVERSMKSREVSQKRTQSRNLKMFTRQGELVDA